MPTTRETAKGSQSSDAITLPTTVNEAPQTIGEYSIALYGDKGIGKSTLAAEFPGPLTFMFEPGRNDAKIRQVPDYRRKEPQLTWSRFKDYLELVSQDSKVLTAIIDNADWAYEACMAGVAEDNGWDSVANVAHGAGWLALRKEWACVNNTLRYTMSCKGGGTVYISHARRRETESLTGETFDWIVPTCMDKCWDYLKTCPIALYYGWRNKQRVLHCVGDENLWAAVPDGRFIDKKTGKQLKCILAGSNPGSAFKALSDGFANKLTNYDPDPETTAILEAAAKEGPTKLVKRKPT